MFYIEAQFYIEAIFYQLSVLLKSWVASTVFNQLQIYFVDFEKIF